MIRIICYECGALIKELTWKDIQKIHLVGLGKYIQGWTCPRCGRKLDGKVRGFRIVGVEPWVRR